MCRMPKAGRICKYIEDRIRIKKKQQPKKNKRKNPTKKTTAYKIKKQGKKRKDTVGIHARIHTEE